MYSGGGMGFQKLCQWPGVSAEVTTVVRNQPLF